MSEILLEALRRLNLILTSTALLVAFSLAAYLFFYNVRNAVARAFVIILATLVPAYVGELFLSTARLPADHHATFFWLRLQWFGIAFAAPAFVTFANALLEATGGRMRMRRLALGAVWLIGGMTLAAVFTGTLVVGNPRGTPGAVSLNAGPLFPLFSLWHFVLVAIGAAAIWRARRRALTPRTRRRTSSLLAAVVAPLSIFPVLTAGGIALAQQPYAFRSIVIAGNAAVTAMLLFVAWEVAYRGALTPERTIRRDLVKYLVQGPLLGVFILATIQLVPIRLQESLGLPRDIVLMLWTIAGIVLYQLIIRGSKPWIDRLIDSGEGEDVRWLRRIDERLVSERDLRQLLENVVALVCDSLRVQTGAIVVFGDERPALEAVTGDRALTVELLESIDATVLAPLLEESPTGLRFSRHAGFLLHPLRPGPEGTILGLFAIQEPDHKLTAADLSVVEPLIEAAEDALRERIVQRRVVAALRALEPELSGIQRLRGALEPATAAGGRQLMAPDAVAALRGNPADDPDFPALVKEALSHYWGGPKLTESPLLGLGVSREALAAHDENPARAMRSVLDRAIDGLRPGDASRSMTASEWLLYNILELKFVRGLKVRDIAAKLAVSESDLYRKQRIAIDAVASQLRAMEATVDGASAGEGPTSGASDVVSG